jgi:SnoaL-like domain
MHTRGMEWHPNREARTVLTEEQTGRFVQDWFDAWNRHDIEAVLSQCAENAQVTSPLVAKFVPDSDGTIHGVADLRRYLGAIMGLRDDLFLEPIDCFVGAESLVLHYRGLACLRVAEVVEFDAAGNVIKAVSHYSRAVAAPGPQRWRLVPLPQAKGKTQVRAATAESRMDNPLRGGR